MTTICLVTKNNESTIEKTLKSLLPLGGKVVIADAGSRDGTREICKRYGNVVKTELNDDYSSIKNRLISDCKGWILFLEPWEIISQGMSSLLDVVKGEPASHRLHIIHGDTLTKQVRLWHSSKRLKFNNPTFESVVDDTATNLPVYLFSTGGRDIADDQRIVHKWAERSPLAPEVSYYKASVLLLQKKWAEFLVISDQYLFQEGRPKKSTAMMRYYAATVRCYINKDYNGAIRDLMPCLRDNPTMAEFWCLMGDIYCAVRQYEKAIAFYENGMILGGRRSKQDDWPMEISKYKDYPTKMIERCKGVISGMKQYGIRN